VPCGVHHPFHRLLDFRRCDRSQIGGCRRPLASSRQGRFGGPYSKLGQHGEQSQAPLSSIEPQIRCPRGSSAAVGDSIVLDDWADNPAFQRSFVVGCDLERSRRCIAIREAPLRNVEKSLRIILMFEHLEKRRRQMFSLDVPSEILLDSCHGWMAHGVGRP
jgi:hypothetical protein